MDEQTKTAARRSLTIGLQFKREADGARIAWGDTELFYPCTAGEPTLTGVAVGAIHSLICHNTAAILDGKDSFTVSVGGEQIELPVYVPPERTVRLDYSGIYQIRESED